MFNDKLFELLFVSCYKHLGTNFSVSNDLKQEVSCRAAIIKSTANSIRKVIANPIFPLLKKLNYIKAHIFTVGFFQCSTWGPLPDYLYNKIHHAVLHVYRVATGNLFNPMGNVSMFCDADVIFKRNLVSPMSMIRSSRLSMFSRFVAKSPPRVFELFNVMKDFDLGGFLLLKVTCHGLLVLASSLSPTPTCLLLLTLLRFPPSPFPNL